MISKAGHILLRFLIILIANDSRSQSFNPRYNFKHLNVQNGLTQNNVYHFLQDSRGYVWIGTHNGLSLFDGTRITRFLHDEQDSTSISRNFISSIREDSAQQVWIGNENGIERYNRADNSFTHFGVDRSDGSIDYTYCVVLGFISANELWFLETKTRALRELNIKTKKTSFISRLDANHASLYKGSDQTIHIWSAYDKGTIHQVYKNKKLIGNQTYFSAKNGLPNLPVLDVNHVLQQNDSTAWLSTNAGLVKLNPITNQYQLFDRWQNEIVKELRYAAFSPSGQLWVGTGAKGIYTFDIKTNQFISNFQNDKLDPFSICSDNIVSLYFDRMGSIWCGSYGSGSSYASTENILFTHHFSRTEAQAWNSSNSIQWLGGDGKGNLWCMISDNAGFWILDEQLKIRMHKDPILENGTHFNGYLKKVLFDKAGNVWCATNTGLYKYTVSSNTMHAIKYELINEDVQGSIWIRDIISLQDTSIIFSTFGGLYHVVNESGKFIVKPIHFLKPGAYIGFGSLFQDKNKRVYIKSSDSLYILQPNKEANKFDLIKSIRFMPDINHFFNGDSVIYLATNSGLYHINSHDFQIQKESFNNKLPFHNVTGVFKKENKYWLFGDKGLYSFDEKSNHGRTYTVEDGLPANEFIASTLVLGTDHRFIAGTPNGIVSFSPDQPWDFSHPPLPQIASIYINDVLHTSAPVSNETQKVDLTFRNNTFSFDFSTIAFQHPADCSFEYKLDGYDETWIRSDAGRYTRYSRIPPGNYVFNLRVVDPSGGVSSFIKTMDIHVSRAFWQTLFFKIIVAAVIILFGWLIARWYFRNKIQRQKMEYEKQQLIEKERTRIATDMHDDLGAGLSRIKYLSQSILNKNIEDDLVKSELERITFFSDEMSEKMGEIVWALNEKNDTLADLIAYTRSYAVEYLANHDIKCEADTPMHLPDTFITGEMRRNIFLSVKECLHNIVKHANARCVRFSVHLGKTIQILIHDDGKGFDWNHRRAFSNGLENINRRMEEIRGEAKFENESGTRVSLTIPFIL